MVSPHPSARRVFIRPPIAPSPSRSCSPNPIPLSDPQPPSCSPSSPFPLNGVVVVGFIGRRLEDVSQLINRIIDANVFGSGNLDRTFSMEKEESEAGLADEVREWFQCRRISYYHDEEKGILYLQFSSTQCPVMGNGFSDSWLGFDSLLDDYEFGDLQGMLFMFSVSHVIIYINEGSHFDTQLLRKFRVLQAAKHAMVPFIRSQIFPSSTLASHSTMSSRVVASVTPSDSPSPRRSRNVNNRHASSISLMSSLGSYTSLFPGQCTPVTLFIFVDDFSDLSPGSKNEESAEASVKQSTSLNSSYKLNTPLKGSGSVVVLARPVNKSECGLRKKLQSSLDSQIRFSIKKCRTLSGSESGHSGARSGGISISAPLFSLDASKAVSLIDISSNQKAESLEFAMGLVEDILNGKETSDSLLLDSHSQSANKEDILSLKEFIYRQSNILRGRGNFIASTNSGSAAGVGMVAVAAAAAAASAASAKAFTSPELPSLDIWLYSSQVLLHGILSSKHGCLNESEINKRQARQRNIHSVPNEAIPSKDTESLQLAISHLEIGRALDTKFSTLWCQRALPVAKEVYLKELPACYPTSQHKVHLEKALHAFKSMVKGPAVRSFSKKLEDDCTSIWCSGRQLCDAVSLTGKQCMHQRHDVELGSLTVEKNTKPHCSGFIFLHACACGRSRRLRSDPFDFDTANINSDSFPECDKHLPAVQLPQGSCVGPIHTSSWSLIRVGGSRYYEPSKGLLQSGFCTTQKFLLKWVVFLDKKKSHNDLLERLPEKVEVNGSSSEPKIKCVQEVDIRGIGKAHLAVDNTWNISEVERMIPLENIKSVDKTVNFGRGIKEMRKPFSEVVAGLSASDSGFPPLQSRKPSSISLEKSFKQNIRRDKVGEQVHKISVNQVRKKIETVPPACGTANHIKTVDNADTNPFFEICSNGLPVNMNVFGKISLSDQLKHVTVYVGFEHECPYGHRFILSSEHLEELGTPYAMPNKSRVPPSYDSPNEHASELGKKSDHHDKINQRLNGVITSATIKARHIKARHLDKSKERTVNGCQNGTIVATDSVKDLEASLQSVNLDDGGCAVSLLNQNLPIYMNCPHCKKIRNKEEASNVKFAGTISQLQRIFLVTPPFPVVLATCPVIQFEESCLSLSISDRERKLQFSLGCRVILPPESFISLKLPFVYGLQLDDGSLHALKPFDHQPELTAWVIRGTSLQLLSKGNNVD